MFSGRAGEMLPKDTRHMRLTRGAADCGNVNHVCVSCFEDTLELDEGGFPTRIDVVLGPWLRGTFAGNAHCCNRFRRRAHHGPNPSRTAN